MWKGYAMSFSELISGKKVIFVGPSPNLIGKGKGRTIDKFDVVVRTNGAFPVDPYMVGDYGQRCEILYINVSFSRVMYPLPAKIYKKLGLKWLVFKAIDKDILSEYEKIIPSRIVPDGLVKWQYATPVMMGVIILRDLLAYKPSRLHLKGIDFFTAKNAYYRGYIPSKIATIVSERTKKNLGHNAIVHDLKANAQEMKKIILENRRIITIDESVREAMEKI